MPSVRLSLIAPAVWLSDRLNFALKYWTLGIVIALVGGYLASPLFEQINIEITMAKMELEGMQLVARQNQIFLQMVQLRSELTTHAKDRSDAQTASITAAIEAMLRNSNNGDETELNSILRRAWGRVAATNPSDKLDTRFATLNMAVNSLLALSRESARRYRLNLDSELDAAFDMMANRLPAVIDSATKQNHVIQWDMDSLAGLALSVPLNWHEAMPTMSAGALQLSRQSLALGDPQRSPALLPANQPTRGDGSASPLRGKMENLLIGLELQQDGVDQWRDTAGAAKRAARSALDILSTSNFGVAPIHRTF